ncbi:hypothetical protein [Streptomyces sp. RTd22]|uniref:hypothetical protein n=1 Tax=Streptomyces sp. RTd22 TaxID=1841249 RepID=UPI0007C52863|nr:hypothetical protein [Streptomyces sp. RTd22]
MTADSGGNRAPFEAATGDEAPLGADPRERAAAVRAAFDGLREIRRLMNTDRDDPLAAPAPWERHQPVRAVALALEAAAIPPSAVGADGHRLATGYRCGEAERPGVVRVEWLGPPGSGAAYAAGEELGRCARVLRELGWEALEYRGRGRHRYLEVEPLP